MQVSKNTFVVFYSGERAKAKILKICDAFRANRYPFPEDLAKQMHTIAITFIIPNKLLYKVDGLVTILSLLRKLPTPFP